MKFNVSTSISSTKYVASKTVTSSSIKVSSSSSSSTVKSMKSSMISSKTLKKNMIEAEEDDRVLCYVRDQTPGTQQKKISIYVRKHNTVSHLFEQISVQYQYSEYQLAFYDGERKLFLNNEKTKTLQEIGLKFDKKANNIFFILPVNKEDVDLDSTISPVEVEKTNMLLPAALPMLEGVDSITCNYKSIKSLNSTQSPVMEFVGLVNQAMTCYLNSLIQALFMTPEFRNALYNWEFDGDSENKSIPYQLQKLFLNLQTSSKLAVETTDLTKSFGWDSTEAWQQHDIQELCRVMFDALEQKFKNTKQADLINRLYEGKMIDYVKCLECGTMKNKEDTFLDIPLPVRPFGSAVAYNSIEEAMIAFVQPETLDGNNQYFCEKCNKKCDAHKGLKFSKFPYILTLHLKRFDFDYQTLHRIKLNDKVTFPQTLNINGLIHNSESTNFFNQTNGDCVNKINDDCHSTADSGSALEEDCASSNFTPNNETDSQEDDEGIDMTSSTDNRNNINNSGPYIYELFAIMIHSGSASGGHYYAYIRDFESGEWYCFNDQTVSSITQEDIAKSFGGGTARAYYSGAYSSSTNAYMLMYRQIDRTRNCLPMKSNDFPEHIQKLLKVLKEKEESDKKIKELESTMQKLKIYCNKGKLERNNDGKMLVSRQIYMANEATLEETLQEAYTRFDLEKLIPIERCRLVAYNSELGIPEQSFEGRDQEEIGNIMEPFYPIITKTNGSRMKELLLEIKDENKVPEVYLKNEIYLTLYTVDIESSDIDGPQSMRCMPNISIVDLKKKIGILLNLNPEKILLAILKNENDARILDTEEMKLDEYIKEKHEFNKIFVACAKNTDEVTYKLKRLVERFEHIITLMFILPKLDKETLVKLEIPTFESKDLSKSSNECDEVDAMMMAKPTNNGTCASTSPLNIPNHVYTPRYGSNLPLSNEVECNSEDSSLSDSDRTLVESVHDDSNIVSSTSHSPINSDQQLSSPEDPIGKLSDDSSSRSKSRVLYFKAVEFTEQPYKAGMEPYSMLKVLVDRSMLIGKLKEHLQSVLKVPMEYFKLYRTTLDACECTRMTESLNSFKDGEVLKIELGRVLRKGEFKLKVYYLNLSEIRDDTERVPFLCEWIFCSGATVEQTKREILSSISQLDKKYDIPFDKCRLRKKNCKNPSKIYFNDEKFDDDIILGQNTEIILQDLRDGNTQPFVNRDDIALFVRKWMPSELTLGPFQEVTITCHTEFKKLLSDLSGIPVENIEYAKINGSFFRYSTSVMTLHTSLSWSSSEITLENWPMGYPQDGHTYYYRDSREKLKELTPEKRREINERENSLMERLGISSTTSTYSPRKERALKIYLDSSPKKRDEYL